MYPICTRFIFTNDNISLHINDFITVYGIIFHGNGTVRGFSFSKQGFSASRAEAEAILFGSDEIAKNKMRNAV